MTELLEHFKCPICFEIPEGKMFQCRNGHTFCSECSSFLKLCPQCRSHLGTERIRNRTLEELLDLIEFDCSNKPLGCDKVLRRNQISEHLKYCKFEPFYFCKLIGFLDCPYNCASFISQPNIILHHLWEAHPEIETSHHNDSSSLHLIYQDLLDRANRLEKDAVSIFTPHLVHFDTIKKGKTFDKNNMKRTTLLFLCQISEVTRNAAWICLRINGGSESHGYHVLQYKIRGAVGKNAKDDVDLLAPEMTWKAPVLDLKDIDKDLESYALRVPFCVLNTLKKGTGSVEMRIGLESLSSSSSKLNDSGEEKENVITSKEDENGRKLKNNGVKIIKELTSFITKPCLSILKRGGGSRCPCSSYSGCGKSRSHNKSTCHEYNETGHVGQSNNNSSGDVVFTDVFCNGCGQRPVVQVRYKCLQCLDYDLCKNCMRQKVHSHHVFARIQDLRQNELLNLKHKVRSQKGKSSYI